MIHAKQNKNADVGIIIIIIIVVYYELSKHN